MLPKQRVEGSNPFSRSEQSPSIPGPALPESRLQEEFARVLQDVDFLATPTGPVAAWRIDSDTVTLGVTSIPQETQERAASQPEASSMRHVSPLSGRPTRSV